MPAIGNFVAWVEVEGRKLPEYKVEYTQDGSKVTCWIPSEAGKKFKILYRDIYRDFSTATSLTVDGVKCQGKISRARTSDGERYKSILTHRGMSISENMIQPYVFSNCHLVEDELDHWSTDVSALGEITMSVSQVILGRQKPFRPRHGFPPLEIYERAKKGIVHGTQLGEPEVHREKPSISTKRLRKIGSFIFKYRPIDVLMANKIAPPLPVPAPSKPHHSSASSKIVIDLTLDDEDEGTNKTNVVPQNQKRFKKEIKQERSITFDNSVIDLTV